MSTIKNKETYQESSNRSSLFFSLILFVKGFCMGVADIIPGVSGGTVAFITGVYNDLLNSLASINKTFLKLLISFKIKPALEHINFKFLMPLGFGVLFAIVSMSRLVHYFMEYFPTQTWSCFFGLIAASIIFVAKQIQNKNLPTVLSLFFGMAFGLLMTNLVPMQTPDSLVYIFFCGLIAIMAMILPGISGSFLLVILGKYLYITSAIKNPFSVESLQIITVFGFGAIIGLISFSKVLKWLLSKYESLTMAFLTGIMLGAMKKLWPWREVLETKVIGKKTIVLAQSLSLPQELNLNTVSSVSLMILCFVAVLFLENLATRKS